MSESDDVDDDLAVLPGLRPELDESSRDDQWQKWKLKSRLFGEDPEPRRVGRFIVLDTLGQGGMGSVLRAYDQTLDRQIAVKLMHASKAGTHDKRTLREAQALARLSHPNVVQVYDVGEIDGQLFIAMELVVGQTLEAWQKIPRPWRERLDAYLQAGRGLAAAHAAGLIHRDFKPANCIIDDDGRVRVLDFGLARNTGELVELDESDEAKQGEAAEALRSSSSSDSVQTSSSILEQRLTQTGSVMGTMAYMAPEQMGGGANVDARVDQFSFCVSLYEALFERRPFADDPVPGLAATEAGQPVEPPGSRIPRRLVRALWRGLSADPTARWPSMDALLEALARHQRRTPWRSLALGSTALGLAAAALWPTPVEDRVPPCHDAEQPAMELWGDGPREQVRRALLASKLPYAPETWSRVDAELGRYVEQLGAGYLEACEATKLRFEQTRDDLQRRRSCLDQRESAMRQTISVLAEADDAVVEKAVALAVALPPLGSCADVAALRRAAESADPGDPTLTTVHERLDQARALETAGKHTQGLEVIATLSQHTPSLSDPTLAELEVVEGTLRAELGEYDHAVELLQRAFSGALQHGADAVAVEALSTLIYVVGIEQAKPDTASWLGVAAEALVDRGGLAGQARAEVITAEGQVLSARGEHAQAQRSYQRALEILRETVGNEHLDLADPLDSLAIALRRQGELEAAYEQTRLALEIRIRWLGERHPDVAHQRINLGAILQGQNEHEQAQQQYREALEILLGAKSPRRQMIAHARTNLGSSLAKLRRLDEAEQELRLAVEDWEAEHGPSHPRVAMVRMSLGRVLHRLERFSEAIEQLERALEILEPLEPTPELEATKASAREWLVEARQGPDSAEGQPSSSG